MPLEAFLLTWIDNLIPITKIFPQFYSNKKNLAELLIITKSFIDCGKGSLQHKNKIFYYRTYLQSRDDDSNSNEIITSSSVLNIKKVFLLFLCDVNYKKKDIDTLTKQIYEILDQGAFDSKDLKVDSSRKLNFLFEQYRNNTENISLLIPLNDIKGSNNNFLEKEKFEEIIWGIYKTLRLPPPSNNKIEQELKRLNKKKDGKLKKEEYKELIKDLIKVVVDSL